MSANTATPASIAAEVAEALGSEWAVTPYGLANRGGEVYNHVAYVTRKDGKAGLLIRVGGWQLEGRCKVSGNYVDHQRAEIYFNRDEAGALKDDLTASVTRGGAAIAKDITRKILDNIVANQAAIMSKLEDAAHDAHRDQTLTERLQAIMPSLSAGGPAGNHFADRLSTGYSAPVNVDVRLTYSGQAEVKIKDLSGDETAAVLQLLAELRSSSTRLVAA